MVVPGPLFVWRNSIPPPPPEAAVFPMNVEFSTVDYGSPFERIFKLLDADTYNKAVEEGHAFAQKVADRYPLLFDTTGDDILRYVNSNPRRRK